MPISKFSDTIQEENGKSLWNPIFRIIQTLLTFFEIHHIAFRFHTKESISLLSLMTGSELSVNLRILFCGPRVQILEDIIDP